jgi:hypothetical protein
MEHARDYLSKIYMDWVNNYLTIAKLAEHNGITETQAACIGCSGTKCF